MPTYRLTFEAFVPDEIESDFLESREISWFRNGTLEINLPVDLDNDMRWNGKARMISLDKQ